MTQLFNITHDADNLSEYDSTVTDGGDLSTGTPGLAETTARMTALVDDTTDIYGQKNIGAIGTTQIRFRFYFHPNSISMGAWEIFDILNLRPGAMYLCLVRYERAGPNMELVCVAGDDAGEHASDSVVITANEEHYIEVLVTRETSDGDADGSVQWWVDGVDQGEFTSNVDNYDTFVDSGMYVRMGAMDLDSGTSGTFYLDELVANDDGSEIGPVPAVTSLPAIVHHLRQQGVM